jgi:hypothetical protein
VTFSRRLIQQEQPLMRSPAVGNSAEHTLRDKSQELILWINLKNGLVLVVAASQSRVNCSIFGLAGDLRNLDSMHFSHRQPVDSDLKHT